MEHFSVLIHRVLLRLRQYSSRLHLGHTDASRCQTEGGNMMKETSCIGPRFMFPWQIYGINMRQTCAAVIQLCCYIRVHLPWKLIGSSVNDNVAIRRRRLLLFPVMTQSVVVQGKFVCLILSVFYDFWAVTKMIYFELIVYRGLVNKAAPCWRKLGDEWGITMGISLLEYYYIILETGSASSCLHGSAGFTMFYDRLSPSLSWSVFCSWAVW